MIPAADREQLLGLARAALEAQVRGERAPDVPGTLAVAASGVFVTAYCNGRLRGCLGTLEIDGPVAAVIIRLAADVSHLDYRFPPLLARELPGVTIGLSLLTRPELVADPASIEVGRDGLIVEQGSRRGLLLPQVAIEHEWDRLMFLRQTCVKAGLPPDAWQNGAALWRFHAEVFGDTAADLGS